MEHQGDFMAGLAERALRLGEATLAFSMVLVFTSLIVKVWRGSQGDPGQMLRAILSVSIVALIIPVFPDWINEFQLLGHQFTQEMGADPSLSHERFARMIAGATDDQDEVGFWSILWAKDGGLGKSLIYAIIFLAAKIASAVMWLYLVLQQVLLLFGVSLAPIFLAMLLIDVLRGIGTKYLLNLASIILWPLGWALTSLFTEELLSGAAGQGIVKPEDPGTWDHVAASSQTLFFTLVCSIWIVFSTIFAPRKIGQILTEGASAGSQLLSGIGMTFAQGISYSGGAAVTANLSGASKGASLGAAAVGGSLGMTSGALGQSGALMPAAVGIGASMMSPSKDSKKSLETRASEMAQKFK